MTKTITKWFLFLCTVLLCVLTVEGLSRREEPAAPPPTGYVLSVFDGRIAVFEAGKDAPVRLTDTRIASLPQTEAERLKKGIRASDEEELQSLIEDYCS